MGQLRLLRSVDGRARVIEPRHSEDAAGRDHGNHRRLAGASAALFTFSNSTKHIHLYQGFGFWPRSLTALLSKPPVEHWGASFDTFSPGGDSDRAATIDACRGVADSVYPGLDLSSEIRVAYEQQLGETVLPRFP
jgi:hypothetical protein